jgi:hypothetical protein
MLQLRLNLRDRDKFIYGPKTILFTIFAAVEKLSVIFSLLIICMLSLILSSSEEQYESDIHKGYNISVEQIMFSCTHHMDAVTATFFSCQSSDNFSRTKGRRSHLTYSNSLANREKITSFMPGKPSLYRKYNNLYLLSPRCADRYVFAIERIII